MGENGFVSAVPEQAGEVARVPASRAGAIRPGYLPGDQRHRARIWLGANVPVGRTARSAFTVLESYSSGLPYEATGTVDVWQIGFDNPGYANPPAETPSTTFRRAGPFAPTTISRTDIAVTLTVRVFQTVELFLQPQVLNLFNQTGVVAVRHSAG